MCKATELIKFLYALVTSEEPDFHGKRSLHLSLAYFCNLTYADIPTIVENSGLSLDIVG